MAALIDEVFGHSDVWQQLQRLASQKKLPHALVFVGPSAVGKFQLAKAFAQRLLCEDVKDQPCGVCPSCQRVRLNLHEALFLCEPDSPNGGQIKIEQAHQILSFLSLRRSLRAQVVIVNDAQTMNTNAANALLKIVEAPPADTYFIFVSNDLSGLLPTLRSRSQIFRFRPMTESDLQKAAGLDVPMWQVASARGQLTRLKQLQEADFAELRSGVFLWLQNLAAGRAGGASPLLDICKDRTSSDQALLFLQELVRDWSLLNTVVESTPTNIPLLHPDLWKEFQSRPQLSSQKLVSLWQLLRELQVDLLAHVDRHLVFENLARRGQAVLHS